MGRGHMPEVKWTKPVTEDRLANELRETSASLPIRQRILLTFHQLARRAQQRQGQARKAAGEALDRLLLSEDSQVKATLAHFGDRVQANLVVHVHKTALAA